MFIRRRSWVLFVFLYHHSYSYGIYWHTCTIFFFLSSSCCQALVWEDLIADPQYFYTQEYEDRGRVREYIPTEKELLESKKPLLHLDEDVVTVVEFYAPWCPHCQHFRKHYIELSEEVARRNLGEPNPPVVFYGVSCDSARPLCDQYDIDGFPTIYGFKKGFSYEKDELLCLNDEGMPPLTADLIGKYLDVNLAYEEPNRLSMSSYSNSEDTRRKELQDENDAIEIAKKQEQHYEYQKSYRETFLDAAKSFVFMMRHGIYVSIGPLPEERNAVLSEWLNLLHWSLPREFGLHDLIDDLRANLNVISLGSEELLSVIDQHTMDRLGYITRGLNQREDTFVDQEDFSSGTVWSRSCSRGKRGMGYTCGLWELFHIMSIGVSERYDQIDKSSTTDLDVSPSSAARVLRNVVNNFFGCIVCRDHFVQNYDQCGKDVCHRLTTKLPTKEAAIQLSIWLWETHNDVNKRLMSEAAHRNGRHVFAVEEKASQWPTEKMCITCWGLDGSFDDRMVYLFLKKSYWPFVEEYELKMLEPKNIGDNIPTSTGESGVYHSIYFFMIGASILILAKLASYLMEKHRLKKSGWHKKIDLYAV